MLVRHGPGRRPRRFPGQPAGGQGHALSQRRLRRFTDIAPQLGMHQPERTLAQGGVGCTVGDYDNDGLLDIFVATYGPTLLYKNLGGGKFREVAAEAGVQRDSARGWRVLGRCRQRRLPGPVRRRIRRRRQSWFSRDLLFMNQHGKFVDVLGEDSPLHAADHGVQWADFDHDGDLDLSLTEDFPDNSRHPLFRNELPKEAREALAAGSGPGSRGSGHTQRRRGPALCQRRQTAGHTAGADGRWLRIAEHRAGAFRAREPAHRSTWK